jgi:hypothetical protein
LSAAFELAALPPAARDAALAALDEISRRITVQEIDAALVSRLTRRERRAILAAFRTLDVIAIYPRRIDASL